MSNNRISCCCGQIECAYLILEQKFLGLDPVFGSSGVKLWLRTFNGYTGPVAPGYTGPDGITGCGITLENGARQHIGIFLGYEMWDDPKLFAELKKEDYIWPGSPLFEKQNFSYRTRGKLILPTKYKGITLDNTFLDPEDDNKLKYRYFNGKFEDTDIIGAIDDIETCFDRRPGGDRPKGFTSDYSHYCTSPHCGSTVTYIPNGKICDEGITFETMNVFSVTGPDDNLNIDKHFWNLDVEYSDVMTDILSSNKKYQIFYSIDPNEIQQGSRKVMCHLADNHKDWCEGRTAKCICGGLSETLVDNKEMKDAFYQTLPENVSVFQAGVLKCQDPEENNFNISIGDIRGVYQFLIQPVIPDSDIECLCPITEEQENDPLFLGVTNSTFEGEFPRICDPERRRTYNFIQQRTINPNYNTGKGIHWANDCKKVIDCTQGGPCYDDGTWPPEWCGLFSYSFLVTWQTTTESDFIPREPCDSCNNPIDCCVKGYPPPGSPASCGDYRYSSTTYNYHFGPTDYIEKLAQLPNMCGSGGYTKTSPYSNWTQTVSPLQCRIYTQTVDPCNPNLTSFKVKHKMESYVRYLGPRYNIRRISPVTELCQPADQNGNCERYYEWEYYDDGVCEDTDTERDNGPRYLELGGDFNFYACDGSNPLYYNSRYCTCVCNKGEAYRIYVNHKEDTNYIINPYIMIDGDSKYFDTNGLPNFEKYMNNYLSVWKQYRINLDSSVENYKILAQNPYCNTGKQYGTYFLFNDNKELTLGTDALIQSECHVEWDQVPNPDTPVPTMFGPWIRSTQPCISLPKTKPSLQNVAIKNIKTNSPCWSELKQYFNTTTATGLNGIDYTTLEGITITNCTNITSYDFLNTIINY